MKIWKKWCKKVEAHNNNLTYVNYEESWSPFTIFTPIMYFFLWILLLFLILLTQRCVSFNVYFLIKYSVIGGLICFCLSSIFLFLNWMLNEK